MATYHYCATVTEKRLQLRGNEMEDVVSVIDGIVEYGRITKDNYYHLKMVIMKERVHPGVDSSDRHTCVINSLSVIAGPLPEPESV